MHAAALFDVSGRTALVTGSSSGLGRHFSRMLAENGARVVCLARRRDRLEQLAAEIEESGGKVLSVMCDVTDADMVAKAFDRAESHFGPVSIVVNNAGSASAMRAMDETAQSWRDTLALNLDAVQFVAQTAARRMVQAGIAGSIVNIASILGLGVSKGLSAYAVSKAGVVQLTRALALEFASSRIRVNAIAPGYIATELNHDYLEGPNGSAMKRAIPLRRFGEPDDLDGVLLLLASEAGRFITGATYVVDGGHTLAIPG